MNITSMSNKELYQTLSGQDVAYKSLLDAPQMKDKIKAVYHSDRDTFNRDKDMLDGSSVTSLFETGSPIRIMTAGGMKAEELAEHFGGIGKRLDEAYAQGKFTKDEYDELNSGLNEYIEKMTARNERMTAAWAVGSENMKERRSSCLAAGITVTPADTRPVKEIQAELDEKIAGYIENVCGIDRSLLLNMINAVRYGRNI